MAVEAERLRRREGTYELRDPRNVLLCRGSLEMIGNHLGGPLLPRGQRVAAPKPIPPEWVSIIDDHLAHMVGAGLSVATRQQRRNQLVRMARELGMPPQEVTARALASWFSIHPEWKPATRRTHRCTARGFFTWAHRTGRLSVDLTDALPRVRATVPLTRPAPDDAVALALCVADPRAALMISLASEAGLQRAEVAQIHTRDLIEHPTEDEVRAALMSVGGGVERQTARLSGAQFPTGRTPGTNPEPGRTAIDLPNADNLAEQPRECAECAVVQEGEARSMPGHASGTTNGIAGNAGLDRQFDASAAPADRGAEGDAAAAPKCARLASGGELQQSSRRPTTADPATFAERLNRLFDTVRPPGGGPTSNAAVVHALSVRGFQISAAYLSQLRSGVRSHPDPDAVAHLAQFFGVPRAYFTDEDSAYAHRIDRELYWLALAHDHGVRRITSALLELPPEVREHLLRAAEVGPVTTEPGDADAGRRRPHSQPAGSSTTASLPPFPV